MSPERRQAPRVPKELPEELITRIAEKALEVSQILANESIGALTKDLPVSRFMTCDLINAPANETAANVRATMKEHGFRHMLVCEHGPNGENLLRGVVSDRDVLNRERELVKDFMAARPFTVSRETGMMHAAAIMLNRRVSSLPVMEEEGSDKLVGLLTLTDMLLGLNCLLPVIEGIAEQLASLPQEEARNDAEAHVTTALR